MEMENRRTLGEYSQEELIGAHFRDNGIGKAGYIYRVEGINDGLISLHILYTRQDISFRDESHIDLRDLDLPANDEEIALFRKGLGSAAA